MKRNTDNYSEEVLAVVEKKILSAEWTLQQCADNFDLSSGRLSFHMRKRGLMFDRKENKWSKVAASITSGSLPIIAEWKPAAPDGYKIDLRSGAVYKTNGLPYTDRTAVLENFAAEFDRYTVVLEQSANALQSAVEERDQLRKDNAELTAALHDITKRYEDQGRQLLIARQDQEKWHSEKYRQDLAKIEATRKINNGVVERTLEFIDRSKS